MPFMGREICPQFPALNFPNTENSLKCPTSHHREHQQFPALHETSSLRHSKALLARAAAVLDVTDQEQSTKKGSAVELLATQPLRKPRL